MTAAEWTKTVCFMVIFIGFAFGYDRDHFAAPHVWRGCAALAACLTWVAIFWLAGGGSFR